jgi:hypothetical protein
MPVTTDRVIEFAMEAFRRHIDDLLDDPSWLLDEDDLDPSEYIAEQRRIAEDLGIDFEELILQVGHDFEISRLRDYEAGNYPAARRPKIS